MPIIPRTNALPGLANRYKGLQVKQVPLDDGVVAEATDANQMLVSDKVTKGSNLYKKALAHEAVHAKEMGSNKIAYGENFVRDGGAMYKRENGKIKHNGEWKDEGDHSFPWEKRAMKGEKNG